MSEFKLGDMVQWRDGKRFRQGRIVRFEKVGRKRMAEVVVVSGTVHLVWVKKLRVMR